MAETETVQQARLLENQRFRAWEDGFKAGLHFGQGGGRVVNPYSWHAEPGASDYPSEQT